MARTNHTCDGCGEPARFLRAESGELRCDRCARDTSAHNRGEVFAALPILDATIRSLTTAGLSDSEVLDLIGRVLDAQHGHPSVEPPVDAGCVWGKGFDYDDRFIVLTAEGER